MNRSLGTFLAKCALIGLVAAAGYLAGGPVLAIALGAGTSVAVFADQQGPSRTGRH